MPSTHIPYGRQSIDGLDVDAVSTALLCDYLTTGPSVEAFEAALSKQLDAPFVVACSSGTAALHLSALCLDLEAGDEVVVPAITFVATANCARYVGAEVRFADVDPRTGLMTSELFEESLTQRDSNRVRAVLPVHLSGQVVDMPAIAEISDRNHLQVVEDACHALGSRGVNAGTASAVGSCHHSLSACFSFHPVKTITTGEGGCVATRDPSVAQKVRRFRSHGIDRALDPPQNTELAYDRNGLVNPWYYEMNELGFNYRISDIQCALGLSQLAQLDHFSERRRSLADRYTELLKPLAPLVVPVEKVPGTPVLHLFVVLIDFDAIAMDRANLMRQLEGLGIGTQVHYIPVHMQPYYRKRYGQITLPGAEAFYESCLSLPLFPSMLDEDVARVVSALNDIIGRG